MEVAGERENERARGRHARGEGASSPLACLLLARPFFLVPTTSKRMLPWIIERLDRKLADVIGSNIVEKCDVTLSRAIQFLTSDVLRVFN